jgi:hypothetical protein
MNTFQIITLAFLALSFLGAGIRIYVKCMAELKKIDADCRAKILEVETNCKIAIAKLEVEIIEIRRNINTTEINALHTEKINREDHQLIMRKIDHLIEIYTQK